MTSLSLSEAQRKLPELVRALAPADEIVIMDDDKPVAHLTAAAPGRTPRLGTLRGTVLYMAPDFDAPLEDFKEYME